MDYYWKKGCVSLLQGKGGFEAVQAESLGNDTDDVLESIGCTSVCSRMESYCLFACSFHLSILAFEIGYKSLGLRVCVETSSGCVPTIKVITNSFPKALDHEADTTAR